MKLPTYQLTHLPTALCHSRDVPFERQLAETEAAQRELPHVGPRAAAQVAAVAQPNLVFRCLLFFRDFCGSGHYSLSAARFTLRARNGMAPYDARNGIPTNCN